MRKEVKINNIIRRLIYVDLENVGLNGLIGIKKLNKNDIVYIYYHEKHTFPNFKNKTLIPSKCEIRLISINKDEKNAVDNQMIKDIKHSMYKNIKYYIISKDNDFKKALSYFKNIEYRSQIQRIWK